MQLAARSLVPTLILLGLLASCGGSSDPVNVGPVPVAPDLSIRGLTVLDVGNSATLADAQVTFQRAADNRDVREYRILLAGEGTALDLAAALSLGSDRYQVAAATTDTVRVNGLLGIGGLQVEEGIAYSVYILSVGRSEEFPGALSSAASLRLENVTAVSSFAPRIVGGTGGIAVGPDGVVYMADFVGRVYRVEPDGTQELLSLGHATPSGNMVEPDGNILQANFGTGTIDRITPGGSRTEFASGLQGPVGMTPMENGEILVVNCNANSISRVDLAGAVSPFSQSALYQCPNSITSDGAGTFYVVNFNDGVLLAVTSDGAASVLATIPGNGNGHVVFRDGELWVTGKSALRIYSVGLDGTVTVVAGSGAYGASDGPALSATIARPNGIVFSPDGRFLYWNDHLGDAVNAYSQGPSVLRRIEFARQ